MRSLRQYLIEFRKIAGFFPYAGDNYSQENINKADSLLLGDKTDNNLFVNPELFKSFKCSREVQKALIEFSNQSDGKDCFFDTIIDAWGRKIKYGCFHDKVWIHSSGSDKVFDSIEIILSTAFSIATNSENVGLISSSTYPGDDILMLVGELRSADEAQR